MDPAAGERMVAVGRIQPRTTAELAAACRQGDIDAWDELVHRHERLVFTIARREGLTIEDAADVTQITFEELLAQLDRIRSDQMITSWLMTVARRQAWRIRNDRQRQYPDPSVTEVGTPHDGDDMIDVGMTMWLYDGLAKLGSPCQELIAALYLDPRAPSYAELASQFRRPVGSIGPTRARCLAKLREILGEL